MMFPCQNVDPDDTANGNDEYLRADYGISCSSDRYYMGRAYAIVMIFVYPVGVPVFYFWLLFSHRQDITSRFSTAVHSHYKTEYCNIIQTLSSVANQNQTSIRIFR